MGAPHKYPVVDGRKQCSRCGSVKPFDAEHFVTQPDKKLGRRILAHCRECSRQKRREYLATEHGRQVSTAYQRKWCAANREKQYASNRRCAKAHPEKRRQYVKDFYARNPDKLRVWAAQWGRRRRAVEGRFTVDDIAAIRCEQDGCCYYCGCALREYHIDHMIPISRGGTHWPDNLALTCPTCNLKKGAKTADEFIVSRLATAA